MSTTSASPVSPVAQVSPVEPVSPAEPTTPLAPAGRDDASGSPATKSAASAEYILGHTDAELTRLILQAQFWERQTRLLFLEAGLGPGMRVLDFGCGVGDVAFLAAQLVGEHGQVVGIDRSPTAVQTARGRAARLGRGQLEFRCLDEAGLAELAPGSFDAVVGRLVLMYQPDPVRCLERLATLLRPGGVVAFHEAQLSVPWNGAVPYSPTLKQIWTWIASAYVRAGLEIDMGLKLHRVFASAGFTDAELLLTARVEYAPESWAFTYLAETVRSLLPALGQFGIATEAEVDIETLAARLRAEITAEKGALVPAMMVGGFARWLG